LWIIMGRPCNNLPKPSGVRMRLSLLVTCWDLCLTVQDPKCFRDISWGCLIMRPLMSECPTMVEHLAVVILDRDLPVAVAVLAVPLEAVTRVALLVVEVDPVEVVLLVAVMAPVVVVIPVALQVVEVVFPVVPLAVVMAVATLALAVREAMACLVAQVDVVEVLVEAEALQVRRILAVAVVPCVGDPVAVVVARPSR